MGVICCNSGGMNRIRELRKARGWTAEDLAVRCNTSHNQITRLETGQRRLTVDWMTRIAQALDLTPAELLTNRPRLETGDDIGPPSIGYVGLAKGLSGRGLKLYCVLTNAVQDAGIPPDTVITVDETPEAIAAAKSGDIVVVDVVDPRDGAVPHRLLRQFIKPRLVVTNRPGVPVVMTIDDPGLDIRLTGVVLHE
jgi:DNA-binding Xre family transcriptional regulator